MKRIVVALVLMVLVSSFSALAQSLNACTFLTLDEISKAVGTPVRAGKPDRVSEGSQCLFPSNLGNVTIWAGPMDAKTFEEFRALIGNEAENVPGLGDAAYFWGERIHVRVGARGLTMWAGSTDAGSRDRRRAAMLALAKVATPKLR